MNEEQIRMYSENASKELSNAKYLLGELGRRLIFGRIKDHMETVGNIQRSLTEVHSALAGLRGGGADIDPDLLVSYKHLAQWVAMINARHGYPLLLKEIDTPPPTLEEAFAAPVCNETCQGDLVGENEEDGKEDL